MIGGQQKRGEHDLDYDHIDELDEISGDEQLVLIWCDNHRAWEWHWIDRSRIELA
jgi:hypothetical protein